MPGAWRKKKPSSGSRQTSHSNFRIWKSASPPSPHRSRSSKPLKGRWPHSRRKSSSSNTKGSRKHRPTGSPPSSSSLAASGPTSRPGSKSHRQQLVRLDWDAENAAGLRAECRAALRIVGTVPDANLDNLAAAKNVEVDRSLGTYTARQERLVTDRAKLLRDKNTIEAAGADGTCPLCRQKLGAHYTEIEKEFAAQLAAIQDEVVAVLAATENLEKEKAVLDGIAPKLAGLRALAESQKVREGIEKELAELAKASQEKEKAAQELAARLAALRFDPASYATAEKAVADLEKMQVRYNELARQTCAGWRGAGAACGHTVPDC